MCGIAGIYFKNPSDQYLSDEETESLVNELLLGIEHRGKHSTGVAAIDDAGITSLQKGDVTASTFIPWRTQLMENPRTILLHTRFATKGSPKNILNNHPIEYKETTIVHNGHISNDDELFKDEELPRIAEVDSEAIAAVLNKYAGDPKEALEKMGGGYAIAAFDKRFPDTVLWAKGPSSPFHYIETRGMFVWASESVVIRDAMEKALGFEVKFNEVNDLKYGEYAVIIGDSMVKDDFKPYYKTYTSTYTPGSYQSNRMAGTRSWDRQAWSPEGWGESYDMCDECFSSVPIGSLIKYGTNWYCMKCENRMFDEADRRTFRPATKSISKRHAKKLAKKEARKRRKEAAKLAKTVKVSKVNRPSVTIPNNELSEKLDAEHWAVCDLVADYYGTKASFVDYILFSDDDIVSEDDPNLVSIYIEFDDRYKEFMEMVSKADDLSCFVEQKRPVGFN